MKQLRPTLLTSCSATLMAEKLILLIVIMAEQHCCMTIMFTTLFSLFAAQHCSRFSQHNIAHLNIFLEILNWGSLEGFVAKKVLSFTLLLTCRRLLLSNQIHMSLANSVHYRGCSSKWKLDNLNVVDAATTCHHLAERFLQCRPYTC